MSSKDNSLDEINELLEDVNLNCSTANQDDVSFSFPLSKKLEKKGIVKKESSSMNNMEYVNKPSSLNVSAQPLLPRFCYSYDSLSNQFDNMRLNNLNLPQQTQINQGFIRPNFGVIQGFNYPQYNVNNYYQQNCYIPNYYNYSRPSSQFVNQPIKPPSIPRKISSKHPITGVGNYEQMNLEEIKKIMPYLCKEQLGCRYLQSRIDLDQTFGENHILPLIIPILYDIITDQFGNYLIQKMVISLKSQYIQFINDFVCGKFKLISTNKYGTRVVQKLMERLNKENQYTQSKFIRALEEHLDEFIRDGYAYYIILKCFEVFDFQLLKGLVYFFENKLKEIACCKFGSGAYQRYLDLIQSNIKIPLIMNIIKETQLLIRDIHGNYLISYIILLKNDEFTKLIVDQIVKEKNILNLLNIKSFTLVLDNLLQDGNCSFEAISPLILMFFDDDVFDSLMINSEHSRCK